MKAPALEGYETAAQAAKRLGVARKTATSRCIRGHIPGAKKLRVGKWALWYVPLATTSITREPSVEGYETTAQAAERLGMSQNALTLRCGDGTVPGAKRVAVGGRVHWYVPEDVTVQRYATRAPHAPRCDTCGIILHLSGDELHANDAADAGRCWDCRDRFGVGPLAAGGSIEGVCDEDLSEVSHAESMTLAAHSMSSQDSAPR